METIKGRITEKSSKSGESDGHEWTRTVLKINGKVFSTFNETEANIGDLVLAAYETKGQYNNIKSIQLIEKGEPETVVEDVRDSPKNYQENKGAEFGLACNLSLRTTLTFLQAVDPSFEDVYRKSVRLFYRWNKELREELLK